MGQSRGAFRYPVDLRAWVHIENQPPTLARVVDLSRTGAGLRLAPAGSIDAWQFDPASGSNPAPARFEPGQAIRVAVADLVEGQAVTRQWQGEVAHLRDFEPGDLRLGLHFALDPTPSPPLPTGCPEDRLNANEAGAGLDRLLGLTSFSPEAPALGAMVALSALVIDQLTKAWAWGGGSYDLANGTGPILERASDWLAVIPAANAGTVASLGAAAPTTARLCALGALAIAGLAPYWTGTSDDHRGSTGAAVGSGLLMAGLLGNSADRLALGYVRDFLVSPLLPEWAFNLADVFLVAGAVTLAAAQVHRRRALAGPVNSESADSY